MTSSRGLPVAHRVEANANGTSCSSEFHAHGMMMMMPPLQAGSTFDSAQMAITCIQQFAQQCQNRGICIGQDTSRFTLVHPHHNESHLNDNQSVLPQHTQTTHALVIGCENAPDCKWFVLLEKTPDQLESVDAKTATASTWQITSLKLQHHPERCRRSIITQQQQYWQQEHQHQQSSSTGMAMNLQMPGYLATSLGSRNPNPSTNNAMTMTTESQPLQGGFTSALSVQPLPPLHNGSHRYVVGAMENQYHFGGGGGWSSASSSRRGPTNGELMNGMNGVMPMMYNTDPLLGGKPGNATWFTTPYDTNYGFAGASANNASDNGNGNGAMVTTPMMSFQEQLQAVELISTDSSPTTNSLDDDGVTNQQHHQHHQNTSTFMTEKSNMVLTTKMRWISAKEASKAINDFALFVQKKRARMDKKTSGGRNKKYVCSCAHCGWFVRLIKVTKSGNWKISSMQLNHSLDCTGEAQPSARQLAEMHAFRDVVVSNAKRTGRVITNEFLDISDWGVKIPLRLAYRAKKMILEKRACSAMVDGDSNDEHDEVAGSDDDGDREEEDGSREPGTGARGTRNSSSSSSSSSSRMANSSNKRARLNPHASLSGVSVPESYKFIPSLLQQFSDSVPGSVVALKKDDKGRFKGVFIYPTGISLSLWKRCFQRVFGLEIIPCTSPHYDGTFIVLLGRDGNLEYRTIAFALIPTPDQSNVGWFLRSVETSGMLLNDSVVFLSCEEHQTLQVFQREFPLVKTMLCKESILKCLQSQCNALERTTSLRLLVEKILQEATQESFEQGMLELQQIAPNAAHFLRSLSPSQWAWYANQTVRLYGWNSTGFAEYVTCARRAILKDDDDPPQPDNGSGGSVSNGTCARHSTEEMFPTFQECAPFDILYKYLSHLMSHETRRRANLAEYLTRKDYDIGASHKKSRLTAKIDALYRVQLEQAKKYNVELLDASQISPSGVDVCLGSMNPFSATIRQSGTGAFGYETDPTRGGGTLAMEAYGVTAFVWNPAVRPKQTFRVNFGEPSCSCLQMHQLGIPCVHFIAVAKHLKKEELLDATFDEIYHWTRYQQSLLTMHVIAESSGNGNVNLNAHQHQTSMGNMTESIGRMPQVSELGKDSSVLPPVCCTEHKQDVAVL